MGKGFQNFMSKKDIGPKPHTYYSALFIPSNMTHQQHPQPSARDRQRCLSQLLTRLLRHDKRFYSLHLSPNVEGLSEDECELRQQGFAYIDNIVGYIRRERRTAELHNAVSHRTIKEVVANQAGDGPMGKIRMELDPSGMHVRALNGHANGVRLDYKRVHPLPVAAYHLTNDEALKSILSGERQGLHPMGRDHVHMVQELVPARLNPRDKKRNVILQVNFPREESELRRLGMECFDPGVNGYLFSRRPIPAEFLERRCTVEEYIRNGYKFQEQ
jgi:RNA:NAD 2'-phosphotransferase (TPT1/KptA family)